MQHFDLAICSLASGSSGNSYLVMTEKTAVLVDAGISGKQIAQRIAAFGLKPEDLKAIFITHEHSDHIKGLKPICRASKAAVIMTEGTMTGLGFAEELNGIELFSAGEVLEVGDIEVRTFATSHDANEPAGFCFCANGRQIAVITDTGYVTDGCYAGMKNADIIVLESNHDESVLRIGRYPLFLKQRILSDMGHLSNDTAAEAFLSVLSEELEQTGTNKRRMVLLAHLSHENNFPEMAYTTMKNVLASGGFEIGSRIRVEVLSRTEQSPLYVL